MARESMNLSLDNDWNFFQPLAAKLKEDSCYRSNQEIQKGIKNNTIFVYTED